ncbi:MAG: DUF1805 domain-containing protein [Deltaproteobacteria bacterium]|nr:DUF1805 domain-containing protein [Candidatus Zymogenaceae bacterium]
MAQVKTLPVAGKHSPAVGLEVSWTDSQFVMIIAEKGVVACGVVDKNVMERAGAAVAIARGTPQKQLVTTDDLLSAKIQDVTEKAAGYGVTIGMSGREALDILS